MEINIKQILFLIPSDLFHRFYSMKINFIKKSFVTHFFDNEMCVENEILDTQHKKMFLIIRNKSLNMYRIF